MEVLEIMKTKFKALLKWQKCVFVLILLGFITYLPLLSIVLLGSEDTIHGQPEIMVILGCQVKESGPSQSLQDRLDEALDYLVDYPDLTIIVSGGQGADEPTTEAFAMAEYLIEQDIPSEHILLEDNSHSTYENLIYSKALMEEHELEGDILVVSNGFHLSRIQMLCQRIWDSTTEISTLAAPTSHIPSLLKMYVREPLALVKSFIFDR